MSNDRINKGYDAWLRIKRADKQITHADLTAVATTQSIDFDAALPDGAVVLAAYLDVDEVIASTGAATSATKTFGNAGPYNMAAGDTIVVDTDNAGNETATFDAAQGYVIDDSYFPVADQDTKTVTIKVDGGTVQTCTFAGATTTAAHVISAINAQITGVAADSYTATAKSATKTFSNAATYDLAPGDTMVVDTNNAGDETATFDAAQGTITDTTAYPCGDQDGLTSLVTIDGGTAQTVTFSGATTTAAGIVSQMNAQLVGCQVSESGGQVLIKSDTYGTDSSVACAAGTGGLTWAAAVAGTGDVANINAVTAAEVKTVVEADTIAEVDITGAYPIISSATTGIASELDFKSGNCLAIFGLSVEVIIGTASQVRIKSDKYGTDSTIEITGGTNTLTWLTEVAGTGDVGDIDAVSEAEVKTVVEADTIMEVDITGAKPVITSPTTGATSELDFKSGNCLTLFGLSVEVVVGTAATAGTSTIDLGISGGDTDALLDGADTSTATGKVNSPHGVANQGHWGGETPAILVNGSVNVNTFTSGDVTATVLYLDETMVVE